MQFAEVHVHAPDRGLGRLAPPGSFVQVVRQARGARTLKASMDAGACHLRGAVTQASGHVVERQQGARRLTVATMAFSFERSTVLCGAMSSIGVSAIVA